MSRAVRLLAASVAGCLLLGACGAGGGQGTAEHQLVGNELKYGASPQQDPAVTYQPDVVFVGGADAVTAVSADGMVWTISGSAQHVDDLQPGKIMFATSLGVGRVLAVSQSGADKQVVIGPVNITDVVRDGDFSSPGPLSLDGVQAYTAPSWPGSVADLPGSTPVPGTTSDSVRLPAVHLLAHVAGEPEAPASPPSELLAAPSLGSLPLPMPNPPPVALDKYTVTSTCCKAGASIHVGYDANGVRMLVTLAFHLDKPYVQFNLKIAGGQLVNANVQLHGAGGVAVALQADAVSGVSGNVPAQRVAVPVDFQVPVFGFGVPLTLGLGQLFSLSTHFTAAKDSLSASADYNFGGSLGFGIQNGKPSLYNPEGFAVKKGLIDNLLNVSAGPSGMDVSYAIKLSIGIGFLGFRAGVWFEMTFNMGMKAAALVSLVACKAASLHVVATYGVGYTIPEVVAALVNKFLSLFGAPPIKASDGYTGPPIVVLDKSDTEPPGSACT